jgi:tetratricopeptide (TPR) repeat protein
MMTTEPNPGGPPVFKLIRLMQLPWSGFRLALSKFMVALLHKIASSGIQNLDYYQAEFAYKVILRTRPDDRLAFINIVELYVDIEMLEEARTILAKDGDNYKTDIQVNLLNARVYSLLGDMSKARQHLEFSWQLAPNSVALLTACGIYHRLNGDLSRSSEFFRASLERQLRYDTLYRLAENLRDQNEGDEAIALMEQSIKLDASRSLAYHFLVRAKYYRNPEHPHLIYIKELLEKSSLTLNQRAAFHFVLGEALDHFGSWDQAFAHVKAGNELRGRRVRFKVDGLIRRNSENIDVFSKDFVARNCYQLDSDEVGQCLIFIVGMPRSGSTLVEQILASHPDVHAGGERRDLPQLVSRLSSEVKVEYPLCVRRLDSVSIGRMRCEHRELVYGLMGRDARFVDKSLGNYELIGLIATLFPRAKIVHCVRDPLDTCISIYFRNFQQISFSNDLRTLGRVYQEYTRMMSHWHLVLPGRIFNLEYEHLVRDPEGQIRGLLDYCELPWHAECLTPHQTKRVVLTASANQVKVPIYSKSIGRWRNYERHIHELTDILSRN